ncbi:uncharacterized protein [Aristolochia californica]|uniref:uncharacterized protein n=1 Tax=Aristolochia californica TaxID=171875 RepID=UPI0035D67329
MVARKQLSGRSYDFWSFEEDNKMLDILVEQLKNRTKSWKKTYQTVMSCLNTSGFGWDATTQRVTAYHFVWQDYIKEHKDAEKYRQQGCPLYEKLAMVVGNTIAVGSGSTTPIDLGDEIIHDESAPIPIDEPDNVDNIKVNIPLEEKPRFWNRKGYLSQNVMAACTFDMQFTYVLAGWEGSATDSRVLKDELTCRNRLFVLEGKYYLVDADCENLPGFLAPYRGTWYHLEEFGDYIPRNEK